MAMDRLRLNARAMSRGLAALQSTVRAPGRSCGRVLVQAQYRRLSNQTLLPRRRIALPRPSREDAVRWWSSTTRSAQAIPTDAKAARKLQEGPNGPDLNLNYVQVAESAWHPTFLRDACTCSLCVDPSSKQKNFQTTDIPRDLEAKSVHTKKNGDVVITWTKDVAGFGRDHVSTIPAAFFTTYISRKSLEAARHLIHPVGWNKKRLTERLEFVNFQDYMEDDVQLWHALRLLHRYGILILRGVPDSEHAVEEITGRIGRIRDTFYGRTWDVKSVSNARNVAYTQQYLGLHMDLLYMQSPPGFQFLHCLKNTSRGGISLFSDGFNAAASLNNANFYRLSRQHLAFEYRNDGQYYYYERPVLELETHRETTRDFSGNETVRERIQNINWSPPFQATLPYQRKLQGYPLPNVLSSLRAFAAKVQNPASVYEYKLNPGECFIFDNRRLLHGRTAFDTTEGERWLKGAYVDTDVLLSRSRVLSEQLGDKVDYEAILAGAQFVHPEEALIRQERILRVKAANIEDSNN